MRLHDPALDESCAAALPLLRAVEGRSSAGAATDEAAWPDETAAPAPGAESRRHGRTLDEATLYACYRRLEKPLYNVLWRWLWQAQDCQDLIHDAFLRVWDRRTRVDAARLDALVWTTALNLARNRLRWRALWRSGEPDPAAAADDDPLAEALRDSAQRNLRRALDTLPQGARQVLLLAEFGGLGHAEIAAVLGIPVGTVGSRRHHALARLRALLEETDHD
jgi:RNA polymerase sigma-70 factor (ECF subfamily)